MMSRFTARAAARRADAIRCFSSVTNSVYSRLSAILLFLIAQKLHQVVGELLATACSQKSLTGCERFSGTTCARIPSRSRSWTRVCAGINWWSIVSLAPVYVPYLHAAVTRWIRSATTLGTAPVNGSVPQVLADPSRAAKCNCPSGLMLTDKVRCGDRYHSTVICPSGSAPMNGKGVLSGKAAKN